jgi:hypothetical protein
MVDRTAPSTTALLLVEALTAVQQVSTLLSSHETETKCIFNHFLYRGIKVRPYFQIKGYSETLGLNATTRADFLLTSIHIAMLTWCFVAFTGPQLVGQVGTIWSSS